MALADELNVEQQSHEIIRGMYERMIGLGWPEEEVQAKANILFEFAKIAGNLMLGEPGIQIPGSDTVIPYDLSMAHQAMELFAEGIYQAVAKARELQLDDATQTQMLQTLAMDVFGQAKQIVASTMGQDSVTNPDLQIPKAQQVEWIQKTAESALSYYASQMEEANAQNNPSGLPTTPTAQTPTVTPEEAPQTPEQSIPPESLIPQPPASQATAPPVTPSQAPTTPAATPPPSPTVNLPPLPSGTTQEKFAATALFLTLLPREHQGVMLQQLTPDEHQWIAFFSNWQHLSQANPSLNFEDVKEHLHGLTQLFITSLNQGDTHSKRRFETLLNKYPREVVSSWMAPERPAVRQWVQQFVPERSLALGSDDDSPDLPTLSPAMTDHLFHYLTQQFG